MKIEEAIKQSKNLISEMEKDTIRLTGLVTADEKPQSFRLYLNPEDRTRYLRINKENIVGEIEIFSEEDARLLYSVSATSNGQVFSVPLKIGSVAEGISVKRVKIGEEYPKEFAYSSKQSASKHALETVDWGCIPSGACQSGCQWCNVLDNTCRCSNCQCTRRLG